MIFYLYFFKFCFEVFSCDHMLTLQRELSRINYDEYKMENLQEHKRSLTMDIRKLRETVERFEAQ